MGYSAVRECVDGVGRKGVEKIESQINSQQFSPVLRSLCQFSVTTAAQAPSLSSSKLRNAFLQSSGGSDWEAKTILELYSFETEALLHLSPASGSHLGCDDVCCHPRV